MNDFQKKVLEAILLIPNGKVTTYKEIAIYINCPKAYRAVGNALHSNTKTNKYPCYKVVNSKGELAKNFKDGINKQKQRLIKSNVIVNNYRVDLDKYLYKYGK